MINKPWKSHCLGDNCPISPGGHPELKTRLPTQEREFQMAAYHYCVPLCTCDSRYEKDLSFHNFPADAKRRRDWIVKIRRDPGQMFEVITELGVYYRMINIVHTWRVCKYDSIFPFLDLEEIRYWWFWFTDQKAYCCMFNPLFNSSMRKQWTSYSSWGKLHSLDGL